MFRLARNGRAVLVVRPILTLGVLIGAFYLASSMVARQILMLTLLGTGLSALLYEQRRSSFEAHKEPLRLAATAVSVGRLATALTHELNSPLGTLKSAAAPGQQAGLVATQAELHRSARQSAERLSQVIARLQRFIELENDEKRPAGVNDLIRDAAILFEPELSGQIRLQCDLQPFPSLSCNPRQLNAVFSSLIGNALETIF
ncbi:MAG: hypothetical protein M3Z23_13255, partial [Acidobacteriota bacterium]|nr:hypothetical protein [Acidobacteriota bacterium]